MKFQKYGSIENSYREKVIQSIINHGYNHYAYEWIATNKIHGANFSFWCDGNEVKCAKRSSFIGQTANFNNWELIYDRYANNILDLYKHLQYENTLDGVEIESITVYGEIYGGHYKHPEVASIPGAVKVQKGVCYCPHNDFAAFDIAVNGETIDQNMLFELCQLHHIPTVEIIHRGTFDECYNLDPKFEDPMYKRFGLPKIENNISEGLVIRPVVPLHFHNGSLVILKSKNELFSEKSKEKKSVQDMTLNEDQKSILNNLLQYMNENRLNSVLSKIEQITNKDFGKVLGLMVQDMLEDYNKDDGELNNLEMVDQKKIRKTLNSLVSEFIRKPFVNLVMEAKHG